MRGKPKKPPRHKNLTDEYMSGSLDEDRVEQQQRFTDRTKHQQQNRIRKTSEMRADQTVQAADMDALPVGQVVQVYSLYCVVERERHTHLCVVRKTMMKVQGEIVVGDMVRFRITEPHAEPGAPDAVVEQILPRQTILTRSDSFKAVSSHPIVANAQQVLIVASLVHPKPKWGLIDRMLVAARAGGLRPIVCVKKIDLSDEPESELAFAREALALYSNVLGAETLETSIENNTGIDALRELLKDKTTVLAGHSGVGKSSLIRSVQPSLDLRVGDVSQFTQKGRHTTSSARHYPLEIGGAVIDTPGVKLFGLWNVTRDTLIEHFPEVESETAPEWRVASYERILASLPDERS